MQSFFDVSIIFVLSTSVVLLLFILISFILVSRRCSSLEKENLKLKDAISSQTKVFDEINNKINKVEESVNKSITDNNVFDNEILKLKHTLSSILDNQKSVLDRQKTIDESVDSLQLKIAQQKKQIEETSVENQPIILAKRLILEGMSVPEVVARTNLPLNEVEMLSTIHNGKKEEKKIEPKSILNEVKAQADTITKLTDSDSFDITTSEEKSSDDLNDEQVNLSNDDNITTYDISEPIVQNKVQDNTPNVASLKARDAYGITQPRSVLRRHR